MESIAVYSVFLVFITVLFAPLSSGIRPEFDRDVYIHMLYLPHDTPVGSVIFRIRATDNEKEPDYPLTFTISGTAEDMAKVESISGTDADIILRKPLELGIIYWINIYVIDTDNERNMMTLRLNSTAHHHSPSLVFTSYPRMPILVKENVDVDHVIGSVTVRKNSDVSRYPELRLSDTKMFRFKTEFTQPNEMIGNILLQNNLDYESKSVYILNITCLGGYKEEGLDTRNIVMITIIVVVEDVQDSPPVFRDIPMITRVPVDAKEGTKIMSATARDGDGDGSQEIKYRLQGKNSEYFQINSKSGEITVSKPLQEIATRCQDTPLVLQLAAEENGVTSSFRTTKEIMLLIDTPKEQKPPTFSQAIHLASINEHSPIFTTLTFAAPHPSVIDNVKCSVWNLVVENIAQQNADAIFDVKPSVILREGAFDVYVKNSTLLDYESIREISFHVTAINMEARNIRNSTTVTVTINDVNDHIPIFSQERYIVTISENTDDGKFIAKVSATDLDTGSAGKIRYTGLSGPPEIIKNLRLDEETGNIYYRGTSMVFDHENQTEHLITVEARDMDGSGNSNTAEVLIQLSDYNDNQPTFLQSDYSVCLPANLRQGQIFFNIWATDLDEPNTVNSAITYRILSGDIHRWFHISSKGNLSLNVPASRIDTKETIVLVIEAKDGGQPPQSSQATVYIFTQGGSCKQRTIEYLVADGKSDVDNKKDDTERLLTDLNVGSLTKIVSVEQMENDKGTSAQLNSNSNEPRTKIVTTVVQDEDQTVVDLTVLGRQRNGFILSPVAEPGDREEVTVAVESTAWKWVLIALLILLGLALLLLLCFCLCCKPDSKWRNVPNTFRKRESVQRLIVHTSSGSSSHKHHHHHHRRDRISSAPSDRRQGAANGRVPANVQYSRHMQDEWNRNRKDDEVLVDQATGKRYLVRNENGRKVLVRQEEKQSQKVTRGTNVTETTLETEAVKADANGTAVLLDDAGDGGRKSRGKNQFLEKKSLFTIAYDGMHSKHDLLKDTDDSPPTVS